MSLSKDRIKQAIICRWDTSSETYDSHDWHGIKSAEELKKYGDMLKFALPENAFAVLDVGCGTGETSVLLAQMGYRVAAVDI